jgi:hypothetical protein
MNGVRGVMGASARQEALVKALGQLRSKGYQNVETFSPIPSDDLVDMPGSSSARKSPVRMYTLAGGILGFTSGLALTIGTAVSWPLITGGKPIVSLPPYLVIAFELTILLGGLFTLAGLAIHARLAPQFPVPAYDGRFSDDRFAAFVPCREQQVEEVKQLFLSAGVEETSIASW